MNTLHPRENNGLSDEFLDEIIQEAAATEDFARLKEDTPVMTAAELATLMKKTGFDEALRNWIEMNKDTLR